MSSIRHSPIGPPSTDERQSAPAEARAKSADKPDRPRPYLISPAMSRHITDQVKEAMAALINEGRRDIDIRDILKQGAEVPGVGTVPPTDIPERTYYEHKKKLRDQGRIRVRDAVDREAAEKAIADATRRELRTVMREEVKRLRRLQRQSVDKPLPKDIRTSLPAIARTLTELDNRQAAAPQSKSQSHVRASEAGKSAPRLSLMDKLKRERERLEAEGAEPAQPSHT